MAHNETGKEIVVSQKNVYTNIFSILVIDVKTGVTKFRFENAHMWENTVKGFLT